MLHRADGGARICHKGGSILPGVNSYAVWLWGNNVDAFSFKDPLYEVNTF